MRLKGARQVHYDSGPNMTPLVAIMMVILIFLMLAGSFTPEEHYLESTTPVTKLGVGGSKSLVPDSITYMITVDSPSPDRFVARAGDLTTSDLPTLVAVLARKRTQFAAAGSINKVQVIINPSRMVKYKYLIAVYQAALEANFTKISFSTAH